MEYLYTIMISYLIGNFSAAYLLGKLIRKSDIRQHGSGNAGATNALRTFGVKIGILSLILDIAKGVLAVYLGRYFLGNNGAYLAGIFVIVGHNWPLLLKFKGGKGVATSAGVLFSLHWPTALVILIITLIVIFTSKIVSLGSLTAAFILPFVGFLLNKPFKKEYFITTIILSLLAIFQHRQNIKRLIEGNEYKFTSKSSKN